MKKALLLLSFCVIPACAADPGPGSAQLTVEKENLRKIAADEKEHGLTTQASELDTQIINLDPQDAKTFTELAETLRKQGRWKEARDLLHTAALIMPENEEIRLDIAMDEIQSGHVDDGLAKLDTIKTLRSKEYYNALGVANDMKGNHDTAKIEFNKGLALEPDNALLLNNLALSYILSRNYPESIDILKDLVKRPDAKPKYRHNLALAYGLSGNYEESSKVLGKEMSKKDVQDDIKTYKKMQAEK